MGILELAQLVSVAAAVVAIVFGVLDRRRQEYSDKVSRAAGVTAWRAYTEAEGEEDQIFGVVIENATNEVATMVDMKAGKLTKKDRSDFASQPDKLAKGLRLALLPQGTWFVPRKDNEWKAQIEVDGTSGARQVWIPESDAPGAPRTKYQLFPETKIEENAPAVYLLRFKIGAKSWWRNEQGVLYEDEKKLPWRKMRKPSPVEWDKEFNVSAKTKRSIATSNRYFWEGEEVPRSRWETINLVAAWWAKKEGLRTVKDFEQNFGKELRDAAPELAARYDTPKLLTDTPATVRNDGNPKFLSINLNGGPYGIKWSCGFKATPQIGVALHGPIIEHFTTKHGAPVTPAK